MKLNRDSQTHINKHNVNLNVQNMAIQRFYSGEHVIFKVNISHSDEYLPPYKQNTLLPEKETFTVVYLGTRLNRGSLLEQTRPCSRGIKPNTFPVGSALCFEQSASGTSRPCKCYAGKIATHFNELNIYDLYI